MTDYGPLVKWSMRLGFAVTFFGVAGLALAQGYGWADVPPAAYVRAFITGFCGWFGVPFAVFVLAGRRPEWSGRKQK